VPPTPRRRRVRSNGLNEADRRFKAGDEEMAGAGDDPPRSIGAAGLELAWKFRAPVRTSPFHTGTASGIPVPGGPHGIASRQPSHAPTCPLHPLGSGDRSHVSARPRIGSDPRPSFPFYPFVPDATQGYGGHLRLRLRLEQRPRRSFGAASMDSALATVAVLWRDKAKAGFTFFLVQFKL
jgi:hypothetical protein